MGGARAEGEHREAGLRGAAVPAGVLAGLFVVSRLVAFACGVRFDANALRGKANQWQLLDPQLLRHDLVASIWYLHSQPPLYNLGCALVLRLPAGLQSPLAALLFASFGLVVVLGVFLLLLDLRVPQPVAFAAATLVILSPAGVLYENWLFYAEPTAALLVLLVLCVARLGRTGADRYALGAVVCGCAVVLLNSTFQWPWLALVVAPLLPRLWRARRRVLLGALAALVAVGGWYLKDALVFGTFTTSSWFGMNLTKTTLGPAGRPEIAAMVRAGRLTPIATVTAFSSLASYVPRFVAPDHTGVAVLDEREKAATMPNFDNIAYVGVSEQYLRDDLHFIAAHPAAYARHTLAASGIWFVPTDQYFQFDANDGNGPRLARYGRLYDLVVGWQLHDDRYVSLFAVTLGEGPAWSQVSWSAVLAFSATLLGGPVLLWRRRRGDPATARTLGVVWVCCAYSFAVTSLVELGENNRFRYELGPLALVGALCVGDAAVRAVARRVAGRSAHQGLRQT